jgi:hypothetical protein
MPAPAPSHEDPYPYYGRLAREQAFFRDNTNGRKVAGEIAQEGFFTELSPIVGPDNASGGRRRRKLFGQCRVILARIGRPRGDVDKGRDFWVDAGFGDNHA